MRILLILAVTYVAVVLQIGLCPWLRIADAAPDMLALEALAVVLIASSPYGFMWAAWIGLLHDLVSAGSLGVAMFWFAAVGYAVQRVRDHFYLANSLARAGVVAAGTAVAVAGVVVTQRLLGQTPLEWRAMPLYSAGVGLYTAAVALPIFLLLWSHKQLAPGA
ncbi:MAG: rod shape-determining protein MreD [Pirellulales bacterium]